MNLNQQQLIVHDMCEKTGLNHQFIIDGLLVTCKGGSHTIKSLPITIAVMNIIEKILQPRVKTRQMSKYKTVLIKIKETPAQDKSELRFIAKESAIAIKEVTGFTVPCYCPKKFSLDFKLQYHHVDRPDRAEEIKVTTLTSNDKNKMRLVIAILDQIVRKQSCFYSIQPSSCDDLGNIVLSPNGEDMEFMIESFNS